MPLSPDTPIDHSVTWDLDKKPKDVLTSFFFGLNIHQIWKGEEDEKTILNYGSESRVSLLNKLSKL